MVAEKHPTVFDKRALYAQSKCQAVVREHEDEISVIIPSTAKSKIIVLGDSGEIIFFECKKIKDETSARVSIFQSVA